MTDDLTSANASFFPFFFFLFVVVCLFLCDFQLPGTDLQSVVTPFNLVPFIVGATSRNSGAIAMVLNVCRFSLFSP